MGPAPAAALADAFPVPIADGLAEGLTEAMADIHRRGWCDGTGGNFSCVAAREPLVLLMAPSGVHKGRVRPEELIAVDASGSVIGGSGKASAETALHLAIVEACGAGAVLHTHSQAGTLLSQWALQRDGQAQTKTSAAAAGWLELADLEMLKGLEGVDTHDTRVRIPVLANDQDLPRLSAKARPQLPEAPHGLLIAGHGLYAWGLDLGTAQRHLEILEFLLEQRWRQLLLQALTGAASAPTWHP
jgi:methylthioribulose-1-phosphate dehydratase